MSTPRTKTRAMRQRFREEVWTAVQVANPGIALISDWPYLGVLLARNIKAQGRVTILRGVHWVRIPQGWRLRLLQLRAYFSSARLPDEWLLTRIHIERSGDFWIARPPGLKTTKVLPSPAERAYSLRILSGAQYERLVTASGRVLRREVLELFAAQLRESNAAAHTWRHWLSTPSPFPLFGH